ncbi:MAG: hypothetical protein FWE21_04950 [Defluviitaleaceae bacterium]|nr:hypothetical protein [Defluviitaleaceae bacterium]
MKIISEASLNCFLQDLRHALAPFKGQMPENIHFINMDSFYFYLGMAYPCKRQEIGSLMWVLEPFIPVIISERNLLALLAAYASGDMTNLSRLEASLSDRSRLSFIQTAITADCTHWQNIMGICRQIHNQRLTPRY